MKRILKSQIPHLTWGIEIQSENRQHSSKALEEVVIPLFLCSIVNEGLFKKKKKSCFVKDVVQKEENLEGANKDLA